MGTTEVERTEMSCKIETNAYVLTRMSHAQIATVVEKSHDCDKIQIVEDIFRNPAFAIDVVLHYHGGGSIQGVILQDGSMHT